MATHLISFIVFYIILHLYIYFDQFSTVDGYHIPSDDPAPRLSFTNFFGRSEQCVFEQISRQEVSKSSPKGDDFIGGNITS